MNVLIPARIFDHLSNGKYSLKSQIKNYKKNKSKGDLKNMANANTVDQLNGLFREVYGDDVENLIPTGEELMKDIPFVKSEKRLGQAYNQPVIVG